MSAPLSPARAIALVARREFRTQVTKKAFLISSALILLSIVGAIVAYSIFAGGHDDRAKIGLVGAPALGAVLETTGDAVGHPVDVAEISDEHIARDRVRDGDLAVVLMPAPDGSVTVITKSDIDTGLRAVIDIAMARQAFAAARQGVDPAELAAAASRAEITVDTLEPPDPAKGQRIALSVSVVVLLYVQIMMFGMYVAMGVVEEKSSRVVELLLSTLRPLHLLGGKVIGIGAVGLIQLAIYCAAGVGVGLATGVLTVTDTAVTVLVGTLGWFVLGYAFFAVLYAAAGSMVSRQEDINATASPLMILIVAMFFTAFSAVSNPDGTLSNVLSWIPPFSAILMPLRIAAGVASPLQIVATIALMLAATATLSVVAAKIYQRSILRIGKTVSWREAFGQ